MGRFREWLKERAGFRPEHAHQKITDALDAERSTLRMADPDTDGQWQSLKAAMARADREAALPKALVSKRLLRPAYGYALAGALILVVSILWLHRHNAPVYETGRGQQTSIVLSDSSEVTLNHTSELIVESQRPDQPRRVTLHGEAYFRVRKSGTPFVVSTPVANIRVLGTEFNVRLRENQLSVAVISGSVRVSSENDGRDSTVVLAGGEFSTCAKGGFPRPPSALPFTDYPGWIHGKLIFDRMDLVAVCKEIESNFNLDIRIHNPRLLDETITGTIDGRSAEAALTTLARLTGSTIRYENNGYTLY